MNKVNNILKMVAQMEQNANELKLGTHEVNLTTISEVEKSYAELKKSYAELEKDSTKYLKLKTDAEDYYKVVKDKFYKVKADLQVAKQIEQKADAAFKELGLPIENSWPTWREALKLRIAVASNLDDRESSYLWKNK